MGSIYVIISMSKKPPKASSHAKPNLKLISHKSLIPSHKNIKDPVVICSAKKIIKHKPAAKSRKDSNEERLESLASIEREYIKNLLNSSNSQAYSMQRSLPQSPSLEYSPRAKPKIFSKTPKPNFSSTYNPKAFLYY